MRVHLTPHRFSNTTEPRNQRAQSHRSHHQQVDIAVRPGTIPRERAVDKSQADTFYAVDGLKQKGPEPCCLNGYTPQLSKYGVSHVSTEIQAIPSRRSSSSPALGNFAASV